MWLFIIIECLVTKIKGQTNLMCSVNLSVAAEWMKTLTSFSIYCLSSALKPKHCLLRSQGIHLSLPNMFDWLSLTASNACSLIKLFYKLIFKMILTIDKFLKVYTINITQGCHLFFQKIFHDFQILPGF